MKYFTIQPPESLKQFVRYFWVLEGDLTANHYVHRSFADGCVEIVFHYKAEFDEINYDQKPEKSSTSAICGQSQQFRRFVTRESFGIFGAYLYPFAVPRIFSFSAANLSDQIVSLTDFLGNDGKELEERMMTATNNYQRIQIISAFLKRKISQSKTLNSPIVRAVNEIIHSAETVNVGTLANNFGFSTRQFERKFKDLAGFSPKLFARITRFQSAVSKRGDAYPTLTKVAYDCGYYDQSHFIHDFKEFSGYHPKTFFRGETEGSQWR